MSEPEYICLSCNQIYTEDEPYQCSNCGENICPKCGGDIRTVEEYDKAMRINNED